MAKKYVGHAEKWDRISIDGSLDERSAAIGYLESDKVRAVATVFRDDVSLEAEVAFERNDQAKLRALVGVK